MAFYGELGSHAFGVVPYGAGEVAVIASGPAWMYLSDRGYATKSTDSLGHQLFEPRVDVPITVDRIVPISPDSSTRDASTTGEIVLLNGDGYFDTMVERHAIDGRDIIVRFGEPGFAYSDFSILFKGTARGWKVADDQRVRIDVRDATWKVELPVTSDTYTGAGGLNGTANLVSKYKPLLYGQCSNVSAVLVDPTNLIYQVHNGSMQAVTAVYDSGASLTPAGDVADITATSVTAGQFKTQLTGGYIRLGSSPVGMVTADCQGDNSATGYITSASQIIYRVLTNRLGLDGAYIDSQSLEIFYNKQPAPLGVFIGTDFTSGKAVLDAILFGLGGWWGCNRLGKIQVGRTEAAQQYQSVASFTSTEILSLDRLDGPDSINPPNYRRRVGYDRNWTVQASDIAASVALSRREYIAVEYRLTEATDSAVRLKYLSASDPQPLPSLMVNQADAQAEADRLLTLYKISRKIFRVALKIQAYLLDIGHVIQITYPRYGLDTGAYAVIVGTSIDAANNRVTLTVMV